MRAWNTIKSAAQRGRDDSAENQPLMPRDAIHSMWDVVSALEAVGRFQSSEESLDNDISSQLVGISNSIQQQLTDPKLGKSIQSMRDAVSALEAVGMSIPSMRDAVSALEAVGMSPGIINNNISKQLVRIVKSIKQLTDPDTRITIRSVNDAVSALGAVVSVLRSQENVNIEACNKIVDVINSLKGQQQCGNGETAVEIVT